jgi:hypothetical protein
MLPCGVRTFLSRRGESDHLPALTLADFDSQPKPKTRCLRLIDMTRLSPTTTRQIDPCAFQRNLAGVLIRFLPLLTLLLLIAPLRAQEEPVRMRPEFPLIFPLTTGGPKNTDVMVQYPVLINPTTVLKPGMVLRVLYVLSTNIEGSSDLALAHHGTLDQSYARLSNGERDDSQKLDPNVAHEIENYKRTVWEIPNNFILAMAQYPTIAMHLIYAPTPNGTIRDLRDERFSFFDGLFVGLPGGKVTVIGVEKESKASAAGIKAGDEILSVGGISTQNDLSTFAAAYASAKKTAMENEVSSYEMSIRSGDKEVRTADIPLPQKLGGGLMDDFTEKPAKP